MAARTTYHCDCYDQQVPLRADNTPRFAAKVTIQELPLPYGGADERSFDICVSCLKNFRAVSAGQVKRG